MARADCGECVCTPRFDQGSRAIDRQAGVSAPADRGALAAPRRSGADHRVSRSPFASAPPCRCSTTAGKRSPICVRRRSTRRRYRRRAPAAAAHAARSTREPRAAGRAGASRCRTGHAPPGGAFMLTNADGVVAAATPAADATIGRRLIDVLGPTQPLTTFGAGAGVMEITLADGTPRVRDRAHAASAARPARGHAAARRGARALALRSPRSPSRCRPPPASWC